MELWAPTFACSPESIEFMDQSDFGFRYCGAQQTDEGKWEFKGSANEDELKKRLQSNFMHVVTEGELNHPERLRSILTMNVDPRDDEQRSFESKAIRKTRKWISEEYSTGDIATARKQLGVSKIEWVSKYVNERLERKNESILLLAWHRDVCTGLAEAYLKVQTICCYGRH